MTWQFPTFKDETLWEGQLEIEGSIPARFAAPARNDLPTVNIGKPEVHNVRNLWQDDQMPLELKAKFNEANFYLVYLSCTFRPCIDQYQFNNGLFSVELGSENLGERPIAHDLYPFAVTQEVERNVNLTFNPSLKFAKKLEGSLGSASLTSEYSEIQPFVIAYNLRTPFPQWEYRKVTGRCVEGSKRMFLLMQSPKNQTSVWIRLNLAADLEVDGNFLRKMTAPFWNSQTDVGTSLGWIKLF